MLTQERIEELRKEEEDQDATIKKIRKEEEKEKRRLREKLRKESINIPLDPERELCAYEKYREKNIKEREEAMSESGYFDDLISYKKEIGLVKKTDNVLRIEVNLSD